MAPVASGRLKKLGVVGRDVVHADAQVAVMHRAVFDDGLSRGADDLRGDGEAGAGERSAAGDDEGVDSHHLAVRVDQRAAGVAGIDGRVSLDKVAGLARIVTVRIGPVEAADNAARDGEGEVAEGIAEGQHRLAGVQLGGVAPGNAGQVVRIDFDDRDVVEFVHSDQLGSEDPAVVQSDAHLRRAVHHMVIGYDVAIRRNDHAAPHPMLDLRLRVHARWPTSRDRRRTGGIRAEDPAG